MRPIFQFLVKSLVFFSRLLTKSLLPFAIILCHISLFQLLFVGGDQLNAVLQSSKGSLWRIHSLSLLLHLRVFIMLVAGSNHAIIMCSLTSSLIFPFISHVGLMVSSHESLGKTSTGSTFTWVSYLEFCFIKNISLMHT